MNPAWNEFLAGHGYQNDAEHCGDLTGELAAARDGTILVPLADLGIVRGSGPDTAEFLHALMTNDVKNLAADGARLAGFCSAKGRLLATPMIWREADDYLLMLSGDLLAAILKKLSMFVLRAKTKLTDASADRLLLGLAGPGAASALSALGVAAPEAMKTAPFDAGQVIGLGGDRYLIALAPDRLTTVWTTLAAHARAAGLAAWHWREISAGVPRIVAATQEAFVPQMVNYEIVGGVSFNKGCYPGQEIVARSQYLGKVKRRMFRGKLPAPAPAGAAIFGPETGEQSVGELVEVAPSPDGGYECLAVMQEACAEGGDIRVGGLDGQRMSLLTLPYAVT